VVQGLRSRYVERYRTAFRSALDSAATLGEIEARDVIRRAKVLAGSAIGAWVLLRADRETACDYCRGIAAEILSWRRSALHPPL
jgi:hypothetical protein